MGALNCAASLDAHDARRPRGISLLFACPAVSMSMSIVAGAHKGVLFPVPVPVCSLFAPPLGASAVLPHPFHLVLRRQSIKCLCVHV